ncbi:MAG: hypothetical protein JOZ41_21440, partial [Chloroflexi bacterium]|nr:hypothetical protein [Chloroflexota bacterium]
MKQSRLYLVVGALLVALAAVSPAGRAARAQEGGPQATGTPTATPASAASPAPPTPGDSVNFFLYAARLSAVDNPGNLEGLAAVRPGSRVWLMMYYIVKSVPRTMIRLSTYTISHGGKTVYRTSVRSTVGPGDVGRSSHYVAYTLAPFLPYGHYRFQASLTINTIEETKVWDFDVGPRTRSSTSGFAFSPEDSASFFLYAARVTTVKNPGNLQGLAAVTPGSQVWLMMYYIVTSVPRNLTRVTTYTVSRGGRTVFKASFRARVGPADTGRSSRYV